MRHRDFPSDAREMWDVIAKALMIRAGGAVTITGEEMRQAAAEAAEIELDGGTIKFRVERQ